MLPAVRSPFSRVLQSLKGVRAVRFEGYQNDTLPNFLAKLSYWVQQFPEDERPIAFLLASRFVFVTQTQFDSLLRRLFRSQIRRHLLEYIVRTRSLGRYQFSESSQYLPAALDECLFVPNSDSSPLNAFVHVNGEFFNDRERRALTGPELKFWTYPSTAQAAGDPRIVRTARSFEVRVLKADPRLIGKKTLIVLEDFSGSGSDLDASLNAIEASDLPFQEIGVAVVIATVAAARRLCQLCTHLEASGHRRYFFWASHILPDALRCFDGPAGSYLDRDMPIEKLSERVKAISERLYTERYHTLLQYRDRHGFGGLALAFATYTNCPDNSLPLLWATHDGWRALYPRVSRII